MKYLLLNLLTIILMGCSDSTSNKDINPLLGSWLSNCYERTDNNGMFIAYAIRSLNINEILLASNIVEYSDINCTMPNGTSDALSQSYVFGGEVVTTDGGMAQRITLTSEFDFFGNTTTLIIEEIYRVTGTDLNFGEYVNGNVPSLNYTVTYVKL